MLGKFIILSFRDDEEALFSKAISAFASVADLSTVAASADAPLLFGSLQIDPQRRLVREAGQTVDRKSTRLNSSHITPSRMPSSA